MLKIIAEFCQNHNGDWDILKRMIAEAAEGGASHVKIQSIFSDDLSYREEFENGKVDDNGETICIKRPYQEEYDRLKPLEISYEQHIKFIDLCKQSDLIPMTTAFTVDSIDKLKDLGFDCIKIASYDCGALALIKKAAKNFKHLFISTGATFDSEIEASANFLNENKSSFSFLHCVTMYPTPLDAMNLKRMNYLKQFTPSVGLSEHSKYSLNGIKACLAAIYLGADVIERHFTVLAAEDSRDGIVSIYKKDLALMDEFASYSQQEQKNYIDENIPEFSVMLGTDKRDLTKAELLNRAYYRGRFCNRKDGKQIFNWDAK
ncbi:MAG: N-acetylneuraminate synthase family protein [Victivallales bacterium]|nr:N-acetylneuraminate synthase family protein [Victivallales bacterium]